MVDVRRCVSVHLRKCCPSVYICAYVQSGWIDMSMKDISYLFYCPQDINCEQWCYSPLPKTKCQVSKD